MTPLENAQYILRNPEHYSGTVLGVADAYLRLMERDRVMVAKELAKIMDLKCETCGGSGEDPETEEECGCIHRACPQCSGSGRSVCRCQLDCERCHPKWEGNTR